MKKIIISAMIALSLSGCAGVLTNDRCEAALRAASTIQEIAAILIRNGVEPNTAAKIAQAVSIGQIAIASACAAVNPDPPGI